MLWGHWNGCHNDDDDDARMPSMAEYFMKYDFSLLNESGFLWIMKPKIGELKLERRMPESSKSQAAKNSIKGIAGRWQLFTIENSKISRKSMWLWTWTWYQFEL